MRPCRVFLLLICAALAAGAANVATEVPARFFLISKTNHRIPAVRFELMPKDVKVTGLNGGTTTYPRSMFKNLERVPFAKANPQIVAELLAKTAPNTDGLPRQANVKRVIDGDTIELEFGETVRLIGIDTPETVHPTKPIEHFGREAAAFAIGMLEGQSVVLIYDQANAAINHRDKYGRLLAYVHRVDGLDFNAVAVEKGFAHAYLEFPCARSDEFGRYEATAREQQLGLWAPQPSKGPRGPPSSSKDDDTPKRPNRTSRERDTPEFEPLPLVDQPSSGGGYWITISSSKRHNSSCRYFHNSNGRVCGPNEGIACKICGG